MIQYLVQQLEHEHIDYILCAPTHKVKIVMERFTKRKVITVYKLLTLSSKLNIMELKINFKDKKITIIEETNLKDFYELAKRIVGKENLKDWVIVSEQSLILSYYPVYPNYINHDRVITTDGTGTIPNFFPSTTTNTSYEN